MSDFNELAERVEALSGPDFAIEQEIGALFEFPHPSKAFTASFDVALLLLPEGWQWRVGGEGHVKGYYSVLTEISDHEDRKEARCDWGATPAIAILAASMKARGL